jgi:hypothetical protein
MSPLTRALRGALVVLLAATGPAVAPAVAAPAAAAAPAEIVGALHDIDTGLPIPNALVAVATPAYELKGWTSTDLSGNYTLGGLEAGAEYVLSVLPPAPYRLQWLPRPLAAGGQPQRFVAPNVVDAALSQDTYVSGTLRDTDGSPAAGARVSADLADGSAGRLVAITDENGRWEAFVEPDTYVFEFAYGGRWSYAYGKPNAAAADHIVVGSDAVVVDDTMVAPRPETSVAGRVTDAATGAPVPGVCPSLTATDDSGFGGGSACTDASGEYTITGAVPGRWALEVRDDEGRYVTSRTAPFDVAEGDRVTGKDVALTAGGSISGLAVDRATGRPLADICPNAFAGRTADDLGGRATCSDATGRWRVDGLAAGTATVLLGGDATRAPMWVGGVAAQAQARQLTVRSGATVDAGTTRLRPGGVVTGRVLDPAGQPVAGTWVELGGYNDRCGFPCGAYAARTGADGRYRIANIAPRTTIAAVVPLGRPYAVQWSGGATDPASARQLTIGYETSTTLDATLAPEATLEVTVTGLPAGRSAIVDAVTLSGADAGYSADLDGAGTVTVRGLPASDVKLKVTVHDPASDRDVVTWFGGTSLETATPIAVAPGRVATATVALPG